VRAGDTRPHAQPERASRRTAEPVGRPGGGPPGWQITTRSRRQAVAMATVMSGGTVHSHTKGEWQARIPHAVLMVVVIGAGTGALRCHLAARPHYGVFVLAFAPWPVTNCAEMPPGRVAGAGTAIGARCAGHHPHGPHGALPDPGIHPGLRPVRRKEARLLAHGSAVETAKQPGPIEVVPGGFAAARVLSRPDRTRLG
jgi:hypothetical protein